MKAVYETVLLEASKKSHLAFYSIHKITNEKRKKLEVIIALGPKFV